MVPEAAAFERSTERSKSPRESSKDRDGGDDGVPFAAGYAQIQEDPPV